MCTDCGEIARLIRLTERFPGSYVAYEITIPGNDGARLIGPDGNVIHPSGTEQLPLDEEV